MRLEGLYKAIQGLLNGYGMLYRSVGMLLGKLLEGFRREKPNVKQSKKFAKSPLRTHTNSPEPINSY